MQLIRSLDLASSQWWHKVHELAGNSSNKSLNSKCLIINDKCIGIQEIVEGLSDHFLAVQGAPENSSMATTQAFPRNFEVAEWEVHTLLIQVKSARATHSKDFPRWVSHENAIFLARPMTNIINTIFKTQKFPNCWEHAEIRPILKCKVPNQLKDFRPISLLFQLSKVAEKCIYRTLKKQLDKKLFSNQYGFTPGVEPTDALADCYKHCSYPR